MSARRSSINAIRGMNDILPKDSAIWQELEAAAQQAVHQSGYQEIRLPVVEKTELFARSIGDETDIVSKEMYTFPDRNDESLTLRPEGTAGCVRAGIEQGLLYNQQQRLWYTGPMFRYEKPQKGRYRQFYQMGVEAYSFAGPAIEAELLSVCKRLWSALGLNDSLKLVLNHLGGKEAREAYKAALVEYLAEHEEALDADSKRRLHTNPLRILDSKSPATQALLNTAPVLSDFLAPEDRAHLDELMLMLSTLGIEATVDPRLVRGLDYYTGVVFEWVTDALGSQGTVCAGGRYDGLVEQLGGHETSAVGFAFGLDRIALLMQQKVREPVTADVYVLALSDTVLPHALRVAEQLRQSLSAAIVVSDFKGGKIKNQMKRADKSGANFALLIGDDEEKSQQYTLKSLRSHAPQQQLSLDDCVAHLKEYGQ